MQDEAALIAAARSGSEDAFAELYRTNISYIKRVVAKVLRTRPEEIDDVCQDTFLLGFTRLASFQGDAKFRTWLTRIAVNQSLMCVRKCCCRPEPISIEEKNHGVVDDILFSSEDKEFHQIVVRDALEQRLQMLTPKRRRVVRLAYLQGFNDSEVASMLGLTLPSVKSALYFSKKQMREDYEASRSARGCRVLPAYGSGAESWRQAEAGAS
jgi:RNA polymerase sigma-70 factor (ECF subfamily)